MDQIEIDNLRLQEEFLRTAIEISKTEFHAQIKEPMKKIKNL